MLGSPILDSLNLGMNLSAFSSPQPSGSMNTTSGRFSPNHATNMTTTTQSSDATTGSYTNTRSVVPTVSMDSYDTHHTFSFNNATNYNNYQNYHSDANYTDANSRLHSAADIILQAATRDMNESTDFNYTYHTNIGQSGGDTSKYGGEERGADNTIGSVTKDNASMSNSNNGYSSYDEKEHQQQQQQNMNQNNNLYDNNHYDNTNSNNNDSDDSSDTSSSDSSTSNSSSDEHHSTDLLIENIPATSTRSKQKQKQSTHATIKPNKKKFTKHTKHSSHTNPKSRSYYTNTADTHTTSHNKHKAYRNNNRSYVDTIDFANSCEWGAPCLMKKDRNFYSDLLKELLPTLQSPSMSANVGSSNTTAGYNV